MQIVIEKLIHGGVGVGTLDGKRIFVPLTAPGDCLDVEIIADHGNYAEARIIRIVEPSGRRRPPPCPVFGQCGGCQWQHLTYDAQLEWKRKILIESFCRIGGMKEEEVEPRVLPTLPSPLEWHYRNRIQLHVDAQGRVGFYRARSNEVVEFEQCLIADDALNAELRERREEIRKRKKGIALRLEGETSFLQINSRQNEQLTSTIAKWLRDTPTTSVLELYAGAGNFTFAIAGIADRVTAADIDRRAIRIAEEEQKRRGCTNIRFIAATAEKAAQTFVGPCDVVVLDPPRKGAAQAIPAIVSLRPSVILYVSCDPATLARDVASLVKEGYHFTKSLPVDMFPQTYHVESMTLLHKEFV